MKKKIIFIRLKLTNADPQMHVRQAAMVCRASAGRRTHMEDVVAVFTVEIAGKSYLTTDGLAAQLDKTPRTVRRWVALGIGPPKIKIGNTPLFDPKKIPGWLAQHEQQPVRGGRGRRR